MLISPALLSLVRNTNSEIFNVNMKKGNIADTVNVSYACRMRQLKEVVGRRDTGP